MSVCQVGEAGQVETVPTYSAENIRAYEISQWSSQSWTIILPNAKHNGRIFGRGEKFV